MTARSRPRTVPLIVSDDERQLELFDTLRHIHPHLVKGPNWKIATRNKNAAESIAEELGAPADRRLNSAGPLVRPRGRNF